MGDIEPLFPNRGDRLGERNADRTFDRMLDRTNDQRPIIADKPLELTRRLDDDPWAMEALIQARSGRRVAWIFACILIVVVGAQAAAIAVMLPLREVVPYVVTVDRQTGYVETARGVEIGNLKEDRAIVESMLAQYVLARETFDPSDFADRYSRVALWSLGTARDEYVNLYQASGADSVLNTLRPGTTVKVTVKAIEVLTDSTARVRFETQRRDVGAEPVRSDFQAIVSFRFTGQPMKMEDRLMNPLGFQVTGYRRDAETAMDTPPAYIPDPSLDPANSNPGVYPEASAQSAAEAAVGQISSAIGAQPQAAQPPAAAPAQPAPAQSAPAPAAPVPAAAQAVPGGSWSTPPWKTQGSPAKTELARPRPAQPAAGQPAVTSNSPAQTSPATRAPLAPSTPSGSSGTQASGGLSSGTPQ